VSQADERSVINPFNDTVIQLSTNLRTFAYLFLKFVMKNFIKISLIIKECPEEILIKLAIVLKISKSIRNTASKIKAI
jgi:hypothetical protein